LDRLEVICIIVIPYSLPSRLIRFRIVDTWIPFPSQRIVCITESTLALGVGTRNCRLQGRDFLLVTETGARMRDASLWRMAPPPG
jgi:hypothetical protein